MWNFSSKLRRMVAVYRGLDSYNLPPLKDLEARKALCERLTDKTFPFVWATLTVKAIASLPLIVPFAACHPLLSLFAVFCRFLPLFAPFCPFLPLCAPFCPFWPLFAPCVPLLLPLAVSFFESFIGTLT